MKNVFKRLTSLLLVFAMLLSFVVVVGAETAKVATLSVDNVAVNAGEAKKVYVPIRLTSHTTHYIVGANASISGDGESPIAITDIVYEIDGADG